ncbi:ParB-like nuclease domain protein [Thalassoglobus neptunius]|uniref:ParB-like nuclease domain protein n=1 Tax=Thalassoglobus neptunius TaxID=1938619 RepID=A0A5C5WI87_9PLAN|nr:ParB N-terminal domain-containing protein [Thalassoglobus neptunius]TWT49829.1 ParB-like nuclease domain protein [Thalassoglobus neptunius]
MIIETQPIQALKNAPYNPRVTLQPGDERWDRLQRSLDEFELVQPIVWNRQTGHVVSGHQRLAVLKHQGVERVECVVVDLPLGREKALNVTLNNAEVGSSWDTERLVDLVSELQDLPEIDATLTGFDDQQLRDLVLSPSDVDATNDENDFDSDPTKMRVVLEIPKGEWETIESQIDSLLSLYPEVRLHLLHD